MNQTSGNLKNGLFLVAKLIVLTVVLVVANGIGSQLLPVVASEGSPAADAAAAVPEVASLSLILAIMFCQVVAVALPVVQSRWHGWRLAMAMFIVLFGTQTFMTQIESLIYLGGKMPEGLLAGLFQMGFVVAAVFSVIAVLVLGKWKKAPGVEIADSPRLKLGRGGWRILTSGLVFLCLYYLFGYYIAWQDPALREYYGGTDPGSFFAQMQSVISSTPWMVPMQFLRGLLWVGLGLLIISSMRGAWWVAGLATALLFSVPSLYLLLPNPVMPDFPRMTHLIETLPYQFLFGWFLAVFLTERQGRGRRLHETASLT